MKKIICVLCALSVSAVASSRSVNYLVSNDSSGEVTYLETTSKDRVFVWTLRDRDSSFYRMLPSSETWATLGEFKMNGKACRVEGTWWGETYTVRATSDDSLSVFLVQDDIDGCVVKQLS